jgi:predicted O-methyltransferase YrrM
MLDRSMIDKVSSWKFVEDFPTESAAIRAARQRAIELGVEAVTPATGAHLAVLAAVGAARNIVEAGTGAGVSGLWLLSASPDSVLTTIDNQPEYQNAAKDSFREAGIASHRTRVISGKTVEVMTNMTDAAYDMVFIDIEPTDLELVLPIAGNLLRPGGSLVIAHALWRDRVPNPVLRDDSTDSMRAVLRGLSGSDDGWWTTLMAVGDGLLVTIKPR